MSALFLLGRALLLTGGSLAVAATLHGLTAPAPQREQPAVTHRWGQVVVVNPPRERGATPSSEGPGFRLGPPRLPPLGPTEEPRRDQALPEEGAS